MDGFSLDVIIKIISNFGVPGIVLIIWWFDSKANEKTLRQYREDMIEMRKMYESNVELVKRFVEISGDLREIVIMNTQAWQRVSDDVRQNQFCPTVRLKKDAMGVQG